jgi:aryl-alcohol dehydrogenase-like predicted oxidoreductase
MHKPEHRCGNVDEMQLRQQMSTVIPRRTLGRTGLNVTCLGYGAMEIRGSRIWDGRSVSDNQAETILKAVLDSGINFIDTSNDYGRSEDLIGRYLADRRDEFYLATKCGCSVIRKDEYTDDTPHIWTRQNLYRGLHESLRRLRTDHIDVMQLHNPKVEQCKTGDLVRVLEDMRKEGTVRWIGCSSTLPDILAYIEWGVFDTFQVPYSALERQHEDIIRRAALSGAGVIVRGGVARGEPEAGLGTEDLWNKFAAAGLDELRDPDESRTAFLLRFTLSHPDISTAIVGTLSPEHLVENISAVMRGPLSNDTYAEAKSRLGGVGRRHAREVAHIHAAVPV